MAPATRRTLLAALTFLIGVLDASAQRAETWHGAIAKTLPRLASGPAGPGAMNLLRHLSLEGNERLADPLTRAMLAKDPRLTPERLALSPDAHLMLEEALIGRMDRARKIIENHDRGVDSPSAHIADWRDAESLTAHSHPYLDAATLKRLWEVLPSLEKKGQSALRLQENLAEGLLAQIQDGAVETPRPGLPPVPAALLPPVPAHFKTKTPFERLQWTVNGVVKLLQVDADPQLLDKAGRLEKTLRMAEKVEAPAVRAVFQRDLLKQSREILLAYFEAVRAHPAMTPAAKGAHAIMGRIHYDLLDKIDGSY